MSSSAWAVWPNSGQLHMRAGGDTSKKDFPALNNWDNKRQLWTLKMSGCDFQDFHKYILTLNWVRWEQNGQVRSIRSQWCHWARGALAIPILPSLWQLSLWDSALLYYLHHFQLKFPLFEHERILTDGTEWLWQGGQGHVDQRRPAETQCKPQCRPHVSFNILVAN